MQQVRWDSEEFLGLKILSRRSGIATSLSDRKPRTLSNAPDPIGTPFYVVFDLGRGNNLPVMVDLTKRDDVPENSCPFEGTLYVGKKANGSLKESLKVTLEDCRATLEMALPFFFTSESGTFDVAVSTWVSQSHSTEQFAGVTVSFETMNALVGRMPMSGKTFVLHLPSYPMQRVKLGNFQISQDIDGDGTIRSSTLGEVTYASQTILFDSATLLEIHSISPSGKTVQVKPKKTATLTGKVVDILEGIPIQGARVQIWPGGSEALSQMDGGFSVQGYEGLVTRLLVTQQGYTPFEANNTFSGTRPPLTLELSADSGYEIAIPLAEIPNEKSGTVTLSRPGSFFGALGVLMPFIGDFEFDFGFFHGDNPGYRGSVCACEEAQQGVYEITDPGSTPLHEINVPDDIYAKGTSVDLNVGNVYVAKARQELPDRLIIFRVESITEDGVTITFVFQ